MMLRYLVLAVALVGGLAVQPPPDPCATGETPCNPDQPWMRGLVEKGCGPLHQLEALRAASPNKIILECACQHTCDVDKDYPHTAVTEGRVWDGRCQARCNPKNCVCPTVCDGPTDPSAIPQDFLDELNRPRPEQREPGFWDRLFGRRP